MKKTSILWLVAALVLIAGAIYYLERPRTATLPTGEEVELGAFDATPSENGMEVKPDIGFMAPDFLLVDYEGNTKKFSDYRGKKVLLNFWATWCPFCVEEMPLFQMVYEEFKDQGFEIVAVNRGESLDQARKFTDPMGLTYSLLLDEGDTLYGDYNGRSMPISFLIDENGVIQDRKFGPYSEEELRAELREFLEKKEVMPEDTPAPNLDSPSSTIPTPTSARPLLETEGTRHSVPLGDIRGGGPPKDGIPSIDDPKFITVEEADEFLDEEGLGIAVSFNGIDRFYPNQILVWHEIVNDMLGDQPALVTYCPLCGTGIVFEPLVNGKRTEFGTSGKLWNSNLVMYDRQTDSYWSQVLGEGIVGSQTGVKLAGLPHDNMLYKDWKKAFPNGQVLSRETGHVRNYSRDPYGDYYTTEGFFFPVDNTDERYFDKEPTWGIEINGQNKVYPQSELLAGPEEFADMLAGVELNVSFDKELRTIKIYRIDTGAEVVPFYGFWFSWIAVHPDSEVWTAN